MIGGAYGAQTDLARAAWRAAADLRFDLRFDLRSRAGRVRAAGPSEMRGGNTQRGPIGRAGGTAAHADGPREVAGRPRRTQVTLR